FSNSVRSWMFVESSHSPSHPSGVLCAGEGELGLRTHCTPPGCYRALATSYKHCTPAVCPGVWTLYEAISDDSIRSCRCVEHGCHGLEARGIDPRFSHRLQARAVDPRFRHFL